MRLTRVDALALLAALAIGLAAAAPLAAVPFFASDDGLVHLWRVWDYARVAREAGPLVRWTPGVAYGYGAPLFTFYNPLPYALGALLVGLGLTAAAATRTVFALSFVLASLGAYGLARVWSPRFGPTAGLCAALLYTLAPYRLATVYQRGALAEALGLAIAPFVVLCALRLVERRSARWVAALALSVGALILSHTIAALLTLPFAGFVALARLFERSQASRLPLGAASRPGGQGQSEGRSGATSAATRERTASRQTRSIRLEDSPASPLPGGEGQGEGVPGARDRGPSLAWGGRASLSSLVRALTPLALGFALGLALGATYWLPAFTQQSTVHLERAAWSGEVERFRAGFAWPWRLIQLSLAHDYGRVGDANLPIEQRFPRISGLAALALAVGALVGLRRRTLLRPIGLVALATIAVAFALASPAARPLWDRLPLLGAVQLGWRFLALVMIAAIPLAAELASRPGTPAVDADAIHSRPRRWPASPLPLGEGRVRASPGWGWGLLRLSARTSSSSDDTTRPAGTTPQRLLRLGALVLALAAGIGAMVRLPLEPLAWSAQRERPAELPAFERKAGQLALGALREYVPRWTEVTPEHLVNARVDPAPATGLPLGLEAATRPTPPAPEPAESVPVDAALIDASILSRHYQLSAAQPATITLDLFYHPALAATLDGIAAPLRPSGPDGLVALDLPPGTHELVVAPRLTTVERIATALTVAALLACIALAVPARRRRAALAVLLVTITPLASPLPLGEGQGEGVPGSGAWWSQSRQQGTAEASPNLQASPIPLGTAARALGAQADTSLVSSAGLLTLDLHLQSLRRFETNEPLELQLVDGAGRTVVSQIGGPGGGFRPTSRWRPNELILARTELRLPVGLPAGRHTLRARLGADPAADVSTLDLPAAGTVDAATLEPPFARYEALFGDALVLDGYTFDRDPRPGELNGTFWWRRTADAPRWIEATLRLLDKQGAVVASESRRTGGDALRLGADFRLRSAPLPPEAYRLELQLRPLAEPDASPGDVLPARLFEGQPSGALTLNWFDVRDPCNCAPPDARPVARQFKDGITLLTYQARRDGDDLDVIFYWRADARPTRNYTMFLHARQGDRVVGQVDDQPNGGRRPTGGWTAGDVVRDHYRLRAPGATSLLVGLYLSDNGQRLALEPATPDNAISFDLPPG